MTWHGDRRRHAEVARKKRHHIYRYKPVLYAVNPFTNKYHWTDLAWSPSYGNTTEAIKRAKKAVKFHKSVGQHKCKYKIVRIDVGAATDG